MYLDCTWLGVVKMTELAIFLRDGSHLFDDDEATDPEIMGRKTLFLGKNPPTEKTGK